MNLEEQLAADTEKQEQDIQAIADEVMGLLGNLVKESDRSHTRIALTIATRKGFLLGVKDVQNEVARVCGVQPRESRGKWQI